MTPDKAKCLICDEWTETATSPRLAGRYLCAQHADLAIHVARKANALVEKAGVPTETQATLMDGFDGLKRTVGAVLSLMPKRVPATEKP